MRIVGNSAALQRASCAIAPPTHPLLGSCLCNVVPCDTRAACSCPSQTSPIVVRERASARTLSRWGRRRWCGRSGDGERTPTACASRSAARDVLSRVLLRQCVASCQSLVIHLIALGCPVSPRVPRTAFVIRPAQWFSALSVQVDWRDLPWSCRGILGWTWAHRDKAPSFGWCNQPRSRRMCCLLVVCRSLGFVPGLTAKIMRATPTEKWPGAFRRRLARASDL